MLICYGTGYQSLLSSLLPYSYCGRNAVQQVFAFAFGQLIGLPHSQTGTCITFLCPVCPSWKACSQWTEEGQVVPLLNLYSTNKAYAGHLYQAVVWVVMLY